MSATTTQIGPYRAVAKGHGGFATVYRTADAAGRPAALKWVAADADRAIVAALEHEYEVLTQLAFPQLPQARDFGLADGRPYIVTDWIEGSSLWERFDATAVVDFLLVLRQIASVLLFLHHRGWVHGDLKPDNFRWRDLSSDGWCEGTDCLCLLDFGLARPVGDRGRPRGAGTIGYCAPEFLRGEPADGRADWYAVGVILYEWMYGQRPFAAAEAAIEIAGHLESSPEFDASPAHPAPEWAPDVIARLLAKKPDDRGRDVMDLMSWLARYDPTLDPYALLNKQLPWHLRSEERRADTHERQLVDQFIADVGMGTTVAWSVEAHGDNAPRLPTQVAFALVREGWSVGLTDEAHAGASGNDVDSALRCLGMSVGVDALPDPLHVHAVRSVEGSTRRLTFTWSPVPDHETQRWSPARSHQERALVNLPWDAPRIEEFLRGLTGDQVFAGNWAEAIRACTGGIPRAVSSVARYLIAGGHLRITNEGWHLDDDRLTAWSTTADAGGHFRAVIGGLSEAEQCLIDWLALGRSYGCRDILEQLWQDQAVSLSDTLACLVQSGLAVMQDLAANGPCFDVRLRLAGLDAVWRAGMPDVDRAGKAAVLQKAIATRQLQPDLIRETVLAECCADSDDWPNAAVHALAAARLEIAADRREVARRHVAAAASAARQIADPRVRAHWVGRARMVQGDLEKAAGQLDLAHSIYRELLILGRQTGDLHLLAETLKDLGDLYRMTRRFEKGVRALRRARRLWEAIGDHLELSRTLTNIGNMYWVAADMAQARIYYQEALSIQRQEPDGERFAAVILSNLGAVNLAEYDYPAAESYLREAYAIHERLNDPVETARTLNNLGALKFLQGRLDEAASLFEAAVDHNRRADAQSEELFNRRNLVEVALERGDLRTAVTLGAHVCDTAAALGDVATGAEASALLAESYLRAGDFRMARKTLAIAGEALGQIKNDDLRVQLALVTASRQRRLGLNREAMSTLDAVAPLGAPLPNRHLSLDGIILRMRIAVDMQDQTTIAGLWRDGLAEAGRIGAPHKAAQLAFARLPEDPACGADEPARQQAWAFLNESPRWHWAGAFQVWRARWLAVEGDHERASRTIAAALAQLRRDGNWETLWRALVVQGRLLHDQADYGPALRSLDEAARIVDVISRTIEDRTERERYQAHPLARLLSETRARIHELVA